MSTPRPKPAYFVSIEKSPSGVSRLTPCLPPDEIRIDALFLRKIFDRAERLGYSEKNGVLHIDVFRRLLQRLTDALQADEPIWKQDCFNLAFQSTEVRWEEVRRGIFEDEGYGGLPRVKITPMERFCLVLEGDGSSIAGLVVRNVVFAAIIVSILGIFGVTDKLSWGLTLQTTCLWIYSVEYLSRLACSPFCRFGVSPDTQWLLDQTVPMPDTNEKTNQAALLPPDRPSRWQRLVAFMTKPMELIDLMAVMPFWVHLVLSMTGQAHNKSLGFLRAFRVLRLFRVARLGKFNSTMTVLGDTARRSLSAFAVMITWITLMSIIIGPILTQLEEGNNPVDKVTNQTEPWPFDTVPASVWWVSGRLCNMHYNLPEKNDKPKSNWSAPLVILIGLFKSPVLLAAVGQLKAAFKAAQDEQTVHEQLEQQVTREQAVPLCAEWTRSPQSPSAEVDILDEDDHVVGTCELNLPIKETAEQNMALTIPIRSEQLSRCCGPRPALQLQVVWKPRPESSSLSPIGRLEIWPLEGMRFRGLPDEEWRCCLRVPIRPDSSEEAVEGWLSELSDDSAPTPSWEGQSAVFEVDWSSLGDLSKGQGSSGKDDKIRQFLQRNTYLLETMASFGMT